LLANEIKAAEALSNSALRAGRSTPADLPLSNDILEGLISGLFLSPADDIALGALLDGIDLKNFACAGKLGRATSMGRFCLTTKSNGGTGCCAPSSLPPIVKKLRNVIVLHFPVELWGWLAKGSVLGSRNAFTLDVLEAALAPLLLKLKGITGKDIAIDIIDANPIIGEPDECWETGVVDAHKELINNTADGIVKGLTSGLAKFMILSKAVSDLFVERHPSFAAIKDDPCIKALHSAFSNDLDTDPVSYLRNSASSSAVHSGYHPCARFYNAQLTHWKAFVWDFVLRDLPPNTGSSFAEFNDFSTQAADNKALTAAFEKLTDDQTLTLTQAAAHKDEMAEVLETAMVGIHRFVPLISMCLAQKGNLYLINKKLAQATKGHTVADLLNADLDPRTRKGLLKAQKNGKPHFQSQRRDRRAGGTSSSPDPADATSLCLVPFTLLTPPY
jgi:hypothetical protein